VLAAVAVPKFINLGTDARVATLNGLLAAVRTTMETVKVTSALRGTTAVADPALKFLDMQGSSIRLWNGYPDRWWDGIGMTLQGAPTISGGGYLSTAPIVFNKFTFYGYSNSTIPNGDAGWVLTDALPPPTVRWPTTTTAAASHSSSCAPRAAERRCRSFVQRGVDQIAEQRAVPAAFD